MKWIPIAKAKVKFQQLYLIKATDYRPITGFLEKSETTNKGVVHTFTTDTEVVVIATHIALITEPA